MNQFYIKNNIEIGLDEVGRGCLFGPVCAAGCIWLDKDPIISDDNKLYIKDSKKCNNKQLNILNNYIINNSISYSINIVNNDVIDNINILQSTYKCMHMCIDDITSSINIDNILVDGNNFKNYFDNNGNIINHVCIINGDNNYKSIACSSILAKYFRDNYINKLVEDYPELKKYDIHNNKGYGTKKHINAIKEYGLTKWHRKSFGICKEYS